MYYTNRGLRGLNGLAIRLTDGNTGNFNNIAQIDAVINQGGIPLRPNGTPYAVQQFMGGTLLDGCPLNVILGQGWITSPDQQGALRAAGITSCLGVTSAANVPTQAPAPAPIFNVTNAPAYTPAPLPIATGFTASGAPITPTGVQQPSAPIVISQAGAPPALDWGVERPPEQQAPGMSTQEIVMYALLGLGVLNFLRR